MSAPPIRRAAPPASTTAANPVTPGSIDSGSVGEGSVGGPVPVIR
ncbi:hypothetical protein [Plantactinospora veratri]